MSSVHIPCTGEIPQSITVEFKAWCCKSQNKILGSSLYLKISRWTTQKIEMRFLISIHIKSPF